MADEVIRLTKRDLDRMSGDDLTNLLLKAHKIEAKFVVRDRHGNIRYDDPTKKGTYGEEYLEEQADGSEGV